MVTAREALAACGAGAGLAGAGLAGAGLAGGGAGRGGLAGAGLTGRGCTGRMGWPGAAVRVCRPAPRVSVPPGEHKRTCSGRYWLSSPIVPLTEVAKTRPSTVRAGPWPQGRVRLADPGGVTGRRSARAGTASWDSLTGSVCSWPVEVTMVAWRTRGKDTSIRLVVSGANRTTPSGGIVAWRVPPGLVIFTVSGVDGRPAAAARSVTRCAAGPASSGG